MWTSPRTWVTGEVVTAALLNTHLRDNLLETASAKVTTAGDLTYATGANALARLAVGGAGAIAHVASGVPAWLALGAAGKDLRVNSGATAAAWEGAVGCAVVSSADQSIANTTLTWLAFDTESFDTDAFHSTSSNTDRITAARAGIYLVAATVAFDGNATGERIVQLGHISSGVLYFAFSSSSVVGASGHYINVIGIRSVAATDYFVCGVYQSSGGALNVKLNSRFYAIWLGP